MIAGSPRPPLSALLLVAALACSDRASRQRDTPGANASSAPAVRQPLFRYIQLNSGRVVLGQRLSDSLRMAIHAEPGDTLVPLPRGSFTGAERITLVLTQEGILRGAVFDYILTADYDALVAEYTADYGPPVRAREQRRGEVPADVATWEDPETAFVLRRDPNRNAWTVRSELWDRARRR